MCNVPRCAVQQVQGGNLQTEDDGSRISSDTVTPTSSAGYQHTGPWVCVLALIVKCDWKLSDRSSSPGPGTYGAPCSMDQPGQDNRHSWGKISITTLRQVRMEIEIGDLEYLDMAKINTSAYFCSA